MTRLVARAWSSWLSHVGADWWITVTVVGGHVAAANFLDVPSLLDGVPLGDRPSLYTATALVVTLTGTLGSTAVGQYMSGRGDRMAHLKRLFPGQLARTWQAVFLGSFLSAGMLVAAYVMDARTPPPHVGAWLFEAAILLTALRYVRLSMLFASVIELSARDDADPLEHAIELTPDLFTRDPANH